jgi:hypothetical protein
VDAIKDMGVHYGHDGFANRDRLVGAMSRDCAKDMASDYNLPTTTPNGAASPSASVWNGLSRSSSRFPKSFDGLRLPAEGGRGPEREGVGKPEGGIASHPWPGACPPCARRGYDLRGV